MRLLFVFIIIFMSISCDKLPLINKQNLPKLDTIVDFTSVDLSPSFKECDSIILKKKKSECFRVTIHSKLMEELQQHKIVTKDSIKEIIIINLLISSDGVIDFEGVKSNQIVDNALPNFDSLLKSSISKLPKVYPAIKRGIPVTTKYQLPIQIELKN